MRTSERIIEYIKTKGEASVFQLVEHFGLSRTAISKQISNLLVEGKVVKIGKSPKVFYMLKEDNDSKKEELDMGKKEKKTIDENYLTITATGERKEGLEGFIYWCNKNNLPVKKTASDYLKTLKKYEKYKKDGIIDGIDKFKNTFKKIGLDHAFYLDFYNIERFGKTKLGQLLLYAKQSQDKKLIRELVEKIHPMVEKIIKKYGVDAVGFIPPTVKREVQFMKELEKNLHLSIRRVTIVKIKTDIIIPQKTLNKLNDRIENARKTIVVSDSGKYDKVLLIDDAIGSGATLNETALQIKKKNIAKKVIGLSVTGSFKGFDVISEV